MSFDEEVDGDGEYREYLLFEDADDVNDDAASNGVNGSVYGPIQ